MKPKHPSTEPSPNPGPDASSDETLRTTLQSGLAGASDQATSQALQERVLAQWQQRHAAPELALAGGPHSAWGFRAQKWATPVLLLAISLALLGWWNRPDPTLEELMQLDVLSQMALGEM